MSEEPMDTTTSSRGRRPLRASWIIVELLVVFVGVYGAFLMSEYQETKRSHVKARQLQCALVDELADIVEGGRQSLPYMQEAYGTWLEQYRKGDRPAPLFQSRGGVHRPSTAIWESALASGAAELLDVDRLRRLADFYHALQILLQKFDEAYAFALAHILPYDGQSVDIFYRQDDPNLRGHYLEYMNTQASFIAFGEALIDQGAGILEDLRVSCGEEASAASGE